MTLDDEIVKNEEENILRREETLSSRRVLLLTPLLFLGVGLFVTFLCFAVMNDFIRGMVRDDYNRLVGGMVQSAVGKFVGLEEAMTSTSALLYFSQEANPADVSEKVRNSVPRIKDFDQVLWVYKTAEGKWRFNNVYVKTSGNASEPRYTLNPGGKLLARILDDRHFMLERPTVVTGLPFVGRDSSAEKPSLSTPFALVKAMEPGHPEQGVLMGVISAGSILDRDWQTEHVLLSHLAIRNLESGLDLYTANFISAKTKSGFGRSHAYDFMFGGSQWEVTVDFLKEDKIRFIEWTPWLVITFGGILSFLGALYLYGTVRQSSRVRTVSLAVEEKTLALEQEIKARAKLDRALQETERENKAIIDAVSEIIFETDEEAVILFLNQRWQSITGFDPEQSKGLELFSVIHPQDQERLRQDFHELIEGRKPALRSFTRLRISSGRFRAVEISISMIYQEGGQTRRRVVGTFTDVEERRQAERALSEAEKKYRAIVENAAGGIFQVTPEGLYLSVNPAMARILGYGSSEEVLREIKNANRDLYLNPRQRTAFLRDLENRGAINNYETQVRQKDGTVIWVSENVRAVRDEGENTLYYEGSLEEITQRKETDLALREAKMHSDLANRAKSEFLANMSHELRTPLNAIIGFSEIIKNEAFGPVQPASYLEYAKDIHQSGERLLAVITEILDISKIDAGERQLNDGIVDLASVIESCLILLGPKIESSRMLVSSDLDSTPHVIGEELAIKQILMNLLSNAIKFTPAGGHVSISSSREPDGSLRVSVTDTGVGLDEGEIKKALSPFGQVHNELSRKNSGTGLGLTLADALARLHGGRLELFSQKGIGTTATFVLPPGRVTVKISSKPTEPREGKIPS